MCPASGAPPRESLAAVVVGEDHQRPVGQPPPLEGAEDRADAVVDPFEHLRVVASSALVPRLDVSDVVGPIGRLERPVDGVVGDFEEERLAPRVFSTKATARSVIRSVMYPFFSTGRSPS